MVTKTITKDLNHTEIEDHLYQKWMENNLFKSDVIILFNILNKK